MYQLTTDYPRQAYAQLLQEAERERLAHSVRVRRRPFRALARFVGRRRNDRRGAYTRAA